MEERKYIDCREYEGSNCSLRIAGSEDEVFKAAVDHAVKVHGYEDNPKMREELKASIKSEPRESKSEQLRSA